MAENRKSKGWGLDAEQRKWFFEAIDCGELIFDPAYFVNPDGSVELREISLVRNPLYPNPDAKCKFNGIAYLIEGQ